jgi:hypothetical protein
MADDRTTHDERRRAAYELVEAELRSFAPSCMDVRIRSANVVLLHVNTVTGATLMEAVDELRRKSQP